MTDFPTLSRTIDNKDFGQKMADPARIDTSENGTDITRPKYTRTPPKMWTFALRDMTNADKLTLETFVEDVKGGSNAFNWTHPITAAVHVVRFTTLPEFVVVGPGNSYRWDATDIEIKEV